MKKEYRSLAALEEAASKNYLSNTFYGSEYMRFEAHGGKPIEYVKFSGGVWKRV